MIKLHAITDGKCDKIDQLLLIELDFFSSKGPPSVAVRILLEHLKIPYKFIHIKYYEGETLGEEFGQVVRI